MAGQEVDNVTPIKEARTRVGLMRTLGTLVDRLGLAKLAGLRFDGKRDFYAVFGYISKPNGHDFVQKYLRQDIASRVVDAPPDAQWFDPPKIEKPSDGQAYIDGLMEKGIEFWSVIRDADRFSRMNHYSVILLGLPGDPKTPFTASSKGELMYMRAIGSRFIDDVVLNTDPRSPDFQKPKKYVIKLQEQATSAGQSLASGTLSQLKTLEVDASRIIHVAESSLEDTVYGNPVMEKCFNILDDLLKVAGGTSETYWLTANRGIQADVDKEMELDPEDAAQLSSQIEEYQHQLRRILRTRGVSINTLDSQTPSPQQVFDMLVALISGTSRIPRRILTGSEAGQLASEQDRANWAEYLEERRGNFAEPVILRPLFRRFQSFGFIGSGKVDFEWPESFRMSPLEDSMMMAQQARAIGNMSRQTGNKNPMQITTREEARAIIKLKGDLPASGEFDAGNPDKTLQQQQDQQQAKNDAIANQPPAGTATTPGTDSTQPPASGGTTN